jgi:hypothetical protein
LIKASHAVSVPRQPGAEESGYPAIHPPLTLMHSSLVTWFHGWNIYTSYEYKNETKLFFFINPIEIGLNIKEHNLATKLVLSVGLKLHYRNYSTSYRI